LERKDSMAVLPTGFGKSMCYVPPSHFGQGKIIYANHLPWYIAIIIVFSKLRDKWLKNKLTWRNDRVYVKIVLYSSVTPLSEGKITGARGTHHPPFFYLSAYKFIFNKNFFISLLFHLFFLILTCSYQYSYNLMLTSNCMGRPYTYSVISI
jgi:hypothetical protein